MNKSEFIAYIDTLSVDEMIELMPETIYGETYYTEYAQNPYTGIPKTTAHAPYADLTRQYNTEFHIAYHVQNTQNSIAGIWRTPVVRTIDPRHGAKKVLLRLYDNNHLPQHKK